MIIYYFMALAPKVNGARKLLLIDSVIPGQSDLFHFIRDFGNRAGLGRYKRLDINPDSSTHGHHLFEHGTVRLSHDYTK
ncbi:hypothetical protein SEA_ATUIN_53 [Arthrobacter phage Atuin]|nr:hypothetical protein SEA_ATUIN_152 [Arthrobacter phage Atuin]